jgi:hypothetical protein
MSAEAPGSGLVESGDGESLLGQGWDERCSTSSFKNE